MSTVQPRRFLVVPDPTFDAATVLRTDRVNSSGTVVGAADNHEEQGRQIQQPATDSNSPAGDIAITLSGEPEVHVATTTRITRGGVVEDARWGWIDSDASTDYDLQLRQSPHVVGKHTDVLVYDRPGGSEIAHRPVRPRLLSLKSGDALCVWTSRRWSPIWADDCPDNFDEEVWYSRLDHTTDKWSDATEITDMISSVVYGGDCISALDITQYPDTGEIIMCVAVSDSMDYPGVTVRRMMVFASTDDGDSWVCRHMLDFDGTSPDIPLVGNLDGDADDETDDSPVQDWALELLDSGRLCLFTVTSLAVWSLCSDDRGASWGVTLVRVHPVAAGAGYYGHGCGATKARNGMAIFTLGLRRASAPVRDPEVFMTRDGIVFSAAVLLTYNSPVAGQFECADITACISPDGWPHIYGTEHKNTSQATAAAQDWIWGRRLRIRDPLISSSRSDLVPATAASNLWAFHIPEGSPAGSYQIDDVEPYNSPTYGGFCGIDAVQHRGQVLMAVTHLQEGAQVTGAYAQAKTVSTALVCFRLNYWQPCQEQLANVYTDPTYYPAFPARGRIYNRTWDCYALPDDCGFSKTGAASAGITTSNRGFLDINGGSAYYTDATLPAANGGLSGALRVVVYIVAGGDSTSDKIAVRLKLSDNTDYTDVSIRFELTGIDTKITVWDNVANSGVSSALSIPYAGWLELLYVQSTPGIEGEVYTTCYVRSWDTSADPDWTGPFTVIYQDEQITTTAGTGDSLRFGHFTTGTHRSFWKSVHLHRPSGQTLPDLDLRSVDWIDDDRDANLCIDGSGEPALDSGIDNLMRSSRTLAGPPQWLSRGVYARFRGEAVTEGEWATTTGYAYAVSNVLTMPALRDWRGNYNDVTYGTAQVFDCGANGIRPDAVAVFGHNVTGIKIQFSTSDSWASPPVSINLGIPGSGASRDRYTHTWAWYGSQPGGLSFTVRGNRILCTGGAPWRPHQFKSENGGQKWYLQIGAVRWVVRIVDNDSTALIVDPLLSELGYSDGDELTGKDYLVVYSDRFAVMIGHHFETDLSFAYRYVRIIVEGAKHWSTDEDFSRIGRIVLGTAVEISAPDFEWGWITDLESGAEIVEQETGAAYAKMGRPILRTVTADRPWMYAPAEASAVYRSPGSHDARATWAQWIDAMRLIDGGATACALVWDGERFVGFAGEELVQVAADPLGLFLCHVTALGSVEHLTYSGQTENLPGGSACVPRPVSHIRGLTFRETL